MTQDKTPSSARAARIREGDTAPLRSLLLVLAAAALFAAPFLPLWRITLDAPQYPEGMGMLIWAHTLTGEKPHDLAIINQLNHYIGMQPIVATSIPELKIMRPLIFMFGLLCLFTAMRPGRWPVTLLLASLAAAGITGLVDFWLWEYDYGHNLDSTAAIKVPGASYQPPLIGKATLLNFVSTSWPAAGGLLLFLAGLLIAVAALLAWRRHRPPETRPPGSGRNGYMTIALLVVMLAACNREPAPIFWGDDACHHCRMTLMEQGFAAQRITRTGKVLKFDAIECLLADIQSSRLTDDENVFVSDRSLPGSPLFAAQSALYLSSERIQSPMGGGLAAFASRDSARAFQARLGGDLMTWEDLRGR